MQVLRSGGERLAPTSLPPWALPAVAGAVAVVTTLDVMLDGPLRHFDDWLFAGGRPRPTGLWFWFWRTVVNGGQYWLVGSIAMGTALILAIRWRSPWLMARAVGWLVGTEVVIRAAQITFGRTSPHTGVDLLYVGGYVAYPSGHAANAAACLLFVAALAGVSRPRLIGVHVLVALVAISVVTLGYHWATDALAGWGLGLVLATAGRYFVPETLPTAPAWSGSQRRLAR